MDQRAKRYCTGELSAGTLSRLNQSPDTIELILLASQIEYPDPPASYPACHTPHKDKTIEFSPKFSDNLHIGDVVDQVSVFTRIDLQMVKLGRMPIGEPLPYGYPNNPSSKPNTCEGVTRQLSLLF